MKRLVSHWPRLRILIIYSVYFRFTTSLREVSYPCLSMPEFPSLFFGGEAGVLGGEASPPPRPPPPSLDETLIVYGVGRSLGRRDQKMGRDSKFALRTAVAIISRWNEMIGLQPWHYTSGIFCCKVYSTSHYLVAP